MIETLRNTFLPELGIPQRGKVRDIYTNIDTLTLIASDRISVFNYLLNETIRDKGRLLTALSLFWFEKTKDIIPNHLLLNPDPNVLIVKRCKVIPLEIVVRRYMVGSLWRQYAAGARTICGIALPEGLKQNDPLPKTIITPTHKSEKDENTSSEEIIAKGIVSAALWEKICQAALQLFARGEEILRERGLILVDTKYEFGLDTEGDLLLIDEIHTPDSSRFWFQDSFDNKEFKYPDKEFTRQYIRDHGFEEGKPLPALPLPVLDIINAGYRSVYEAITGQAFIADETSVPERLLQHLKKNGIIRGCYVLIACEAECTVKQAEAITAALTAEGIPAGITVAADHEKLSMYNESLEPMVCIAIGEGDYCKRIGSCLKWPVLAATENDNLIDLTLHRLRDLESN